MYIRWIKSWMFILLWACQFFSVMFSFDDVLSLEIKQELLSEIVVSFLYHFVSV